MDTLLYWHWILLGLGLIILEMLLPGFVLVWFGIAALIIGGLLFVFPNMAWELQLLLFAVLSLTSLFAWKKLRKGHVEDDPETTFLNQRGQSLIGRKTVLIEAINDGVGRIKVDDTFWRVEGEDMAEGSHVIITAASGATLKVIAAD